MNRDTSPLLASDGSEEDDRHSEPRPLPRPQPEEGEGEGERVYNFKHMVIFHGKVWLLLSLPCRIYMYM